MSATATKKMVRMGYSSVRAEVEKPLSDRRKIAPGRDGKSVPRRFHLMTSEIDQLDAKFQDGKDKLPNPHNKGNYYFSIEALKALGLDARHSIDVFTRKLREIMQDKSTVEDEDGVKTTAWQRFINKKPRNAKTALDQDARILQNLEVLQRVNVKSATTPYGLKLLQVGQKVLKTAGCVIDITKTGDTLYVSLNTNSATPINERRRARKATTVTGTAKPKAKKAKAKKASVSKPRVRKPKTLKATPDVPATEVAAEPETAETVA